MAAPPQPLSFSDFLEKMKEPAAADLVRLIKAFIRTFEERGRGHRADPEADSKRVQDFLLRMEQQFRVHPVWWGSRPEVLDQAAEGLEKYVMSKVWRETFGAGQEDRDRDERYARLMAALGFVDLPTLMGLEEGEVAPDPALLDLAMGELLKVERYKAPRDKLLCLVNVKTMVEGIVAAAAGQGANIGGADAFFPVFLYVVLCSRLPHLASNVEYVKRFRGTARLTGQFDYMLCNLESVAMYLDTVNYKDLRVSQDEFLARLSEAGIPEADIELRSLQRQRAAAAAGGGGAPGSPCRVGSPRGPASPRHADAEAAAAAAAAEQQQLQQEQQAADGSAAEDGQKAGAAESAAAALAAQAATEEATAGAAAVETSADELGGAPEGSRALELQQRSSSGGSLLDSLPVTPGMAGLPDEPALAPPVPAAALPSASPASHLSELTPSRQASQSPQPLVLPAAAAAGGPSGAGAQATPQEGARQREREEQTPAASAEGRRQQQQGQARGRGGASPGGVSPGNLARRLQYERAAAAAGLPPQLEESPIVTDMVADGTRHVLEAEAKGQLQLKYPYMYASAGDLSLADVERVLAGYKELLLRYEALALCLEHQLLDDVSPASFGFGFGSFFVPSGQGDMPTSPRLAPRGLVLPVGAPPDGGGGSAAAAADGLAPDDAGAGAGPGSCPSKWSPSSLLQRISSRGRSAPTSRSSTPPRGDRGGEGAAPNGGSFSSTGAAAAGEAALPRSVSPVARLAAAGKQAAQHPIFGHVFGRGRGPSQRSSQASEGQPEALDGLHALEDGAQAWDAAAATEQAHEAHRSAAEREREAVGSAAAVAGPAHAHTGSPADLISLSSAHFGSPQHHAVAGAAQHLPAAGVPDDASLI